MLYNDPTGTPAVLSSIGKQARTDYYEKKALVSVRNRRYFTPLASVTAMPKNMGKKIIQDVYIPLLDARNINDQGINASGVVIANGNLYGSSRDIGTITDKIPMISENGGRVNRVGFTRIQVTGEIKQRGFFHEYSRESVDFDSDASLVEHITQECVEAATDIYEAELQTDLLTTAASDGIAYYCGGTNLATTKAEVTYRDLLNVHIALDANRCPRDTKVITGSRMIDTKTISYGRIMYAGPEAEPVLRAMKDFHGNPAFTSVEKYSYTDTLPGEIGTIGQFRVCIDPEMQINKEAVALNGNAFPLLVVGDGSFATIGFQTGEKSGSKFKIIHKKPGEATADKTDPYGMMGFYSMAWYYGFLPLRPERLAVIWSVEVADAG